MTRCVGVAASLATGQDLALALSLALEALELCIGKHDELAICVEDYAAAQAKRRARLSKKD